MGMTPEMLERVLDAAFTEITKLSAENAALRAELATSRRLAVAGNFTEPNHKLQVTWLDLLKDLR
jgi:hypothetical protein